MHDDEELLLALLNSAPIIDGRPTDALDGPPGRDLARRWGGTGTDDESAQLRRARGALQAAVRHDGTAYVDELASIMQGAVRTPRVTPDGVRWELAVADDDRLAIRALLAWSTTTARHPGRLRPCANDECALYLLDRSRPGTARWCSMSTCGNRMKARAYAQRRRT